MYLISLYFKPLLFASDKTLKKEFQGLKK